MRVVSRKHSDLHRDKQNSTITSTELPHPARQVILIKLPGLWKSKKVYIHFYVNKIGLSDRSQQ